MQRYRILHRTYYDFSTPVQIGTHELRLRPRSGHDLFIESSSLKIEPEATLRWQRDVEDNIVAIANFAEPSRYLSIGSEVVIQQYDETPLDFLVADDAIDYPFNYTAEDRILLSACLDEAGGATGAVQADWMASLWQPGEVLQTYALLMRLTDRIHSTFRYQVREVPGVQTPLQTLESGSGSCRDFATLFMESARHLGFAARFVSGYLCTPPSTFDYGATHAWAEVYLPGAGWKGFDPTVGDIAGRDHIAVAVARLPESVPPVAGSSLGPPGARLEVGVWVTPL